MLIVTRNGNFDASELLGIAIVQRVAKPYEEDIFVKRIDTTDNILFQEAEVAIGVGGEYKKGCMRFDWRQPDYLCSRPSKIPYTSAGLVWDAFGFAYIKSCCSEEEWPAIDHYLQTIAHDVDKELLIQVDAIASGLNKIPPPTCVSSQVAYLTNLDNTDEQFYKALELCAGYLTETVKKIIKRYRDQEIVISDIADSSGQILVLSEKDTLWTDVLLKCDPMGMFKLVVMEAKKNWVVQTIPITEGCGDHYRQLLPLDWAGKRGKDLEDEVCIDDVLFCDEDRTIAGAVTKEAAIAMAAAALEEE